MNQSQEEAKWTKKICDEIRMTGPKVYVLPGTATSSGLPDRLVVSTRGIWLLEFKYSKTKIRLNQKLCHVDIAWRSPRLSYIIRYPNLIYQFNGDGNLVKYEAFWDGTGAHLIECLCSKCNHETAIIEPFVRLSVNGDLD